MKHIVFLLMYLLAGGAFCLQALEMDSNGCIRAEVLRFSVTCFMPGWKLNAMQSRLPGKVTKILPLRNMSAKWLSRCRER